jgi:hypothetical protein
VPIFLSPHSHSHTLDTRDASVCLCVHLWFAFARAQVPERYRFPFFQELQWYAAMWYAQRGGAGPAGGRLTPHEIAGLTELVPQLRVWAASPLFSKLVPSTVENPGGLIDTLEGLVARAATRDGEGDSDDSVDDDAYNEDERGGETSGETAGGVDVKRECGSVASPSRAMGKRPTSSSSSSVSPGKEQRRRRKHKEHFAADPDAKRCVRNVIPVFFFFFCYFFS